MMLLDWSRVVVVVESCGVDLVGLLLQRGVCLLCGLFICVGIDAVKKFR